MIQKLLNFQHTTITSAALVLMASAFASRLLGIVRDRLLASRFGAGEELDVYFAAFRIPDFLYAFLVSWGVVAVFLPLFSDYMAKNKEEAWRFASNMLNVYAVGLGAFSVIAAFFMPFFVGLIVPGFTEAQQGLAVSLSRIMLLSPFFFALSSVASGVLHYFQRFIAYAAAPILYNIGIIIGVVFLEPWFGIWGLGYGVILGAMMHFLILVPSLFQVGFSWRPSFSFFDAGVRRALLLSFPRTIGGAAHHINLMVVTALASTLSAGSLAVFTFADNLQHFPVGMIGLPLALAAFPALSKAAAGGEKAMFSSALFGTLGKVIAITLPVAFLLFFFKDAIVALILQAGAFGAADARITARVFGIFTLGMVFQGVIPILVRAFFALKDTMSPTTAGVLAVALNIVLATSFLNMGWGVLALPWALVISGAFQAALLSLLLYFSYARKH